MDCVMVLYVVENRKFLFASQVRMHPPHKKYIFKCQNFQYSLQPLISIFNMIFLYNKKYLDTLC
jgi:hypothetical protein